ncbi:hypothetical protein TGAMA5MH_00696 [Trichoderma gamsii]|uniref:Uncharacterized protein n=1 Tax=Trichoderma gamsii TaxID=398673 RepID=A0A2K0TSA7_9HYPO|nr:hypothetical protein TGAMA5MH_00696 [Trichoderma gamsii]
MSGPGLLPTTTSGCTVQAKPKPQQGSVKTHYVGFMGCTVM